VKRALLQQAEDQHHRKEEEQRHRRKHRDPRGERTRIETVRQIHTDRLARDERVESPRQQPSVTLLVLRAVKAARSMQPDASEVLTGR